MAETALTSPKDDPRGFILMKLREANGECPDMDIFREAKIQGCKGADLRRITDAVIDLISESSHPR